MHVPPADSVGVVVPRAAVPHVLLIGLVVGELGVDVEVVCLPVLSVDVTIISANHLYYCSDLFNSKTTYPVVSEPVVL